MELLERVATLEAQVQGIHEKLDKILEQVIATNGRLRKIEVWRAWLTGGVVITLGAVSLAATVMGIIVHVGK